MPDTYVQQPDTFGVDHYRPKSIYRTLTNVYSNLYYCCNKCNYRKKSKWRRNAKEFVPNPCDHWMAEHLRYQGDEVVTRSPAGNFTEELLQLNHRERIEARTFMRSHFEFVSKEIGRLLELRKKRAVMKMWFLGRGIRLRHLRRVQKDLVFMRRTRNALLGIVLDRRASDGLFFTAP